MKSELTLIPRLTIHPNKLCLWNEINWDPVRPSSNKLQLPIEAYTSNYERIRESTRTSNGKVSINARRKMLKALDYLLFMSRPQNQLTIPSGKTINFSVAFITLTLPSQQIHDDNTIKKECLNQILIELSKRHNVTLYLWRAEKQKNGNLHFHIIVNKFVNWNELRNRWNRIINKLGYIDRYQANQKAYHSTGFRPRPELFKHWSYEQQLKAYREGAKHDFTNPNTTDVHGLRAIKNIRNYVTKYITKDESQANLTDDPQAIYKAQKGRIWSCSQILSDIKGAQLVVDNEISEAVKKVVENSHPVKYEDTYFSVYYTSIVDLAVFSPDVLFIEFARYMADHFKYSQQLYTG